MVSGGGNYDCSHDGGDVEVRPGEHLVEDSLCSEVVSDGLDTVFHGDPALVVDGFGLIAIVVGLDDEPGLIGQFVRGMDAVGVSFDDHSLIGSHTGHNVVNRGSDPISSETLDCCCIGGLLFKSFPEQPADGNGVVLDDADQIVRKTLSSTGIHIDGERSESDSSESEDTADHGINSKQSLSVLVVLDIDQQLGQQLPHLEIQVTSMHYLAVFTAHQEAGAGRHSGELVHEVEEEDLLEGVTTQFGQGIDLAHEVLVLEFVLGVPLDTVVEALGDGEEVQVLHETGDWLFEVNHEGRPADLRGVIERDLVGEGLAGLDGADVRHHCGAGESEEAE